jgi:hypothetical protein
MESWLYKDLWDVRNQITAANPAPAGKQYSGEELRIFAGSVHVRPAARARVFRPAAASGLLRRGRPVPAKSGIAFL